MATRRTATMATGENITLEFLSTTDGQLLLILGDNVERLGLTISAGDLQRILRQIAADEPWLLHEALENRLVMRIAAEVDRRMG